MGCFFQINILARYHPFSYVSLFQMIHVQFFSPGRGFGKNYTNMEKIRTSSYRVQNYRIKIDKHTIIQITVQ